jgi:hypothetical protein
MFYLRRENLIVPANVLNTNLSLSFKKVIHDCTWDYASPMFFHKNITGMIDDKK